MIYRLNLIRNVNKPKPTSSTGSVPAGPLRIPDARDRIGIVGSDSRGDWIAEPQMD